jgi:hypothetical protein
VCVYPMRANKKIISRKINFIVYRLSNQIFICGVDL